MKLIKKILQLTMISLLILACQSNDLENVSKESHKDVFLSTLRQSKKNIKTSNIAVTKTKKEFFNKRSNSSNDVVSFSFPNNLESSQTNQLNNETKTFSDIIDVIQDYNAILTYDNSDSDVVFEIPTEELSEELQPLLIQSKEYLYSKGFDDSEINQMLIDEGGEEVDLIMFVLTLVLIESGDIKEGNLNSENISEKVTYKDYIRCAIIGIGADAIWALGGSSASTWSKAAMKKAFGAVAKRFLGPIGVAIAVGTFGICIAEAYLND